MIRMGPVHGDQRDSTALIEEEFDGADVEQLRSVRQLEMEQQAVLNESGCTIGVESGPVRTVAGTGERVPRTRIRDDNGQIPHVLQSCDVASLIGRFDDGDSAFELENEIIAFVTRGEHRRTKAAVDVWEDP